MPELPDRPNLDQLRRQARELLRAAADGEPSAQTRLRAVSERITLSAAQLAVAREYGFASWPALRAGVELRLAEHLPGAGGADHGEIRWSFGGAAAVETAAGVLYPGILIAGEHHGTLDARLMPSENEGAMAQAEAILDAVTLIDDQGTRYTLRVIGMSGVSPVQPGQERGLMSARLRVRPVPPLGRGWLELRGQDGSAARLQPSPHPDVRVSRLAPMPDNAAQRELTEQARWLISLYLTGTGQDAIAPYCSAALTRAAQLQQAGQPGAVGDLPAQLTTLCALLTGQGPADGLPREWSDIIDAGQSDDGPRQHLDISVALPLIDATVVRVDYLGSEPDSWQLHLRAEPGWWIYSVDRQRKWAVVSVDAVDDLGGRYLDQFGGSVGKGDVEELILSFRPRLNPRARTLTLTFTGTSEEAAVELRLP
jgi:hypothetical protein